MLESLPLVEPLTIPKEISEYAIELLTYRHLREEGIKMKHCVGGYGVHIKTGISRIISIKTTEGNSTMELRKHKEGYWFGAQHRGTANSFPNPENRKHATSLIKFLNTGVNESDIDRAAEAVGFGAIF